ncbi:Protein N-acetyltransferase, RimJ/RimL family [Vibrio hangzhouensis]|uniref:Protein N-acetyltransferase, RimJ/RimL family n=1 Tax=Vibrio hangzhouensis TaxID=462991 RepID=A0A1H5VGK6_9VIBR|nr:Protein N-acetyltransferase, RimJ/RimL family [Vibrio hangzhouensis]
MVVLVATQLSVRGSEQKVVIVKVREAQVSDAESILELMFQLDTETKFMLFEEGERKTTLEQQVKILETFSESNIKSMFVLADELGVHGFSAGIGNSTNRNRHSMYCVMGIKQSVSGKGYGKQLLGKLEAWAIEHHFSRLELTVMCHNERAYNLYLSQGFEVEGTKRNSLKIDCQYVDEYYMSKLLRT